MTVDRYSATDDATAIVTTTAPVHETVINAVYNGDDGHGDPDSGSLYRIRHTADDVEAAIRDASRAYMDRKGGIHPETPTRGPGETSFDWGDAVTHLPEEPELMAEHGILDITVLDITPGLVVNHDDDLLA